MKKTKLLALIGLLIAATVLFAYQRYVAPTRIVFVNYMDFMYDEIVQANDNSFIHTEQKALSEDIFRSASRYDAIYLFAHGGVRLNDTQKEQVKAAIASGTAVIYRSPSPTPELEGLAESNLKYVNDCLQNSTASNIRRMLNYTRRVFDGKKTFVEGITDPFVYPKSYYYHLGDEEIFADKGGYISFLKKSGRYKEDGKNIAFVASQFGASSETGFINQLISRLEASGHNVFPIGAYGSARVDYVKAIEPDMVIYNPHGKFGSDAGIKALKEGNILMLCPVVVFKPVEEWRASKQGMDGGLLSQNVTMPELDGGIVPFVIGAQFKNERGLYVFRGIEDRIETFISLSNKYLALKDMPNTEKKVAIFYLKEAGKNALVAESLEVVPSLWNLLQRLKKEGYDTGDLPATPASLEKLIQQKGPVFGSYAKGSIEDYRKQGDPAVMSKQAFEQMLQDELKPELVQQLRNKYGPAPGGFMTYNNGEGAQLIITRIELGNIVLLPVPPVGYGENEVEMVHGDKAPPSYPYVGAYLWARTQFDADAIMHFGTHGSVEFTPEKQVALSNYDWPDALLAGTPHFYVYVINNIGEAMIAKRRSYAVMQSHLTSPLSESGLYGPSLELDDLLEKYFNAKNAAVKVEYQKAAHRIIIKAGLDQDMEFDIPEGELVSTAQLKHLHHYLHDLEMGKITKGLHVLGQPYTDEEINSTVELMALDSLVYNQVKMDKAKGNVTENELGDAHYMEDHYRSPSSNMIDAILEGTDPESFVSDEQQAFLKMYAKPSVNEKDVSSTSNKVLYNTATEEVITNTQIDKGGTDWILLDASNAEYSNYVHPAYYNTSTHMVLDSSEGGAAGDWVFAESSPEGKPIVSGSSRAKPAPSDQTESSSLSEVDLSYLNALESFKSTLISVNRYKQNLIDSPVLELNSIVNSLNGGYTAPQSGGDPAFNPEAVPSGRNHYSINASKTPSKEAFSVARKLIDKLLSTHLADSGKYPERVAVTLWSSEFIRQEGVTIAEIFYLLGVEPVADRRGTVHDVKLIPIEELGRPRIDVIVQTSGQFRDLAASRIYLINRAVKLASEAKDGKSEFENYVKQGVQTAEELMKERGTSPSEARELANIRVFGGLNGNYGASIMGMVEDGDSWESEDEIAERYLVSMGAMYGKNAWGDYQDGALEAALGNAEMVIQPRSANTWGALSLDHVYEFMGGISNAIRYTSGKDPAAYFSDLRSLDNPIVQSLESAIWTEARTTLLNPKYIRGMQEEGATAADTFAETFRNTYSWEVMKTSAIDPKLWDNLTEVYVDDIHNLSVEEYFRDKNPYALQEMTAVMLEVVRKGYWKPQAEVQKKIAELHANLVKDHEAGCSGFVCDNAKLLEFISGKLDQELSDAFNEAVAQALTVEITENVQGMELSKVESKQESANTKYTKDKAKKSIWPIAVVVVFVIFIAFNRLRRKA